MKTIWDVWIAKRFRWGALLIIGGVVGFLLMAFILRLPLVVTIILSLFFGVWGVAAAVLEAIVKAVANSRAPFTFRQREPYEFVRTPFDYINLCNVTKVHLNEPRCTVIWLKDGGNVILTGDAGDKFVAFMDEIATPLAVAPEDTPKAGNSETDVRDVRFFVDEDRINEIEMWRGRRPF